MVHREANAEFVCAITCWRSTIAGRCNTRFLDETCKQQVKETRTPLPPTSRRCHSLQPNAIALTVSCSCSLEGWRRVEVTDRRTKLEGGNGRGLPRQGPEVLVMDNLNTHPVIPHLSLA